MTKARAVRIREPGEPSVLELVNIDVREPGFGELAIDVAAAGLNRADLLQRRGLYPPPPGFPPDIPGLEYAGTVAAAGPTSPFRVGDRVMGIVGGGSMATRIVVHEREAIPVPANLTLPEAAAIPEVFLTAFDALFTQAALRPGETVLTHATGSGVGTAMIQLAAVVSAVSIGTSRSAEKLEQAKALGLNHGIVPLKGAFADEVNKLTNGRGANVVADCIGGAYLAENVSALANRGRLILYGTMAGAVGELPLGLLMFKRAQIFGTMLRGRPLEEKALLAQTFAREAVPLFASGKLRPVIHSTLPMSKIADAHATLERNETFGKIVLVWD